MSTVMMVKCDGCGEVKEALPNNNNLPIGWRSFNVGMNIMHGCKLECGVKAVVDAVRAVFAAPVPKY